MSKTIDNGQRLGCLQRSDGSISSCSDTSESPKIPSVRLRTSGLSVYGLTVRNVSKPVDFHKLMNVIAAHLRLRAVSLFLCQDNWLIRDLLRTHKIHSLNGTESGFHTISKEVRFDTNTNSLLGTVFLTQHKIEYRRAE